MLCWTHQRPGHVSLVMNYQLPSLFYALYCSAVEGINQIVTGDLIAVSEQEPLDCDIGFNEGCNCAIMDYAFEFTINNGGIDTEAH
ncbi:hypothetical protein KFK09_017536 [Dendrobium nobile]|uniref:Peptidase C1A papain C-terminal domain-containing protein n=1 Tax=Dendrobium nobile TaxID=94219 RepID=A0A8T3B3Q3_DENNO|nr:hypothetical protein KFK09_017536 [Dendrobium nobile]